MERVQSAGQAVNELERDEGVRYWRASEYEAVSDSEGGWWVQAAQNAEWKRFSPFEGYGQPDAAPRMSPRGPHTEFLAMKAALLEQTGIDSADHEAKEIASFANRFGLLGLIYKWYSTPILPAGKLFVLPDAAITNKWQLVNFDNNSKDISKTRGFHHLQRRLQIDFGDSCYRLNPDVVAWPSELRFAVKRNRPAEKPDPGSLEPYPELDEWAEVKERFGALILLDPSSGSWARVQITRERVDAWLLALPAYSKPFAELSDSGRRALAQNLRADLQGISPYPSLGDDGEWKPGWRCPSLLQAICLLLYYDLTGGAVIRRCDRKGCGNYFRTPEGSRRIYCPGGKCASAATSKAHRDRKAQFQARQ